MEIPIKFLQPDKPDTMTISNFIDIWAEIQTLTSLLDFRTQGEMFQLGLEPKGIKWR